MPLRGVVAEKDWPTMPTRKSSEKGLHDASDCDTFAGDAVREGAGRCVAGRVDVYVELVLWAGDPTLDALGADGEGPAAHLRAAACL